MKSEYIIESFGEKIRVVVTVRSELRTALKCEPKLPADRAVMMRIDFLKTSIEGDKSLCRAAGREYQPTDKDERLRLLEQFVSANKGYLAKAILEEAQ